MNFWNVEKIFQFIQLLWLLIIVTSADAKYVDSSDNSTIDGGKLLERNKRFLIYTYGGAMRITTSVIGPVDLPRWQTINCGRNFQFSYNLPTTVITIYNKFPKRSLDDFTGDSTRKIAYLLVQSMLNRDGIDGKECLLRTICEVADTPIHHNGLVGELLHVFFTPGDNENVDDEYKYAKAAGRHGVNCIKMYPKCPFGHGFLDTNSIIHDFRIGRMLTWF